VSNIGAVALFAGRHENSCEPNQQHWKSRLPRLGTAPSMRINYNVSGPLNEENRRAKITQFAKEYGLHLGFYKHELCAIFEKKECRADRKKNLRTAAYDGFFCGRIAKCVSKNRR
jgi:hypothetical protein